MTAARAYPKDLPPMWLGAALLLIWGCYEWFPGARWLAAPWPHVGWAVMAAGTGLGLSSIARFRRLGTGVVPFTPATALVLGGAYRWTRNPMYVALVTVATGLAIKLPAAPALAVPPLLWFVLDRRFVRREEAFLRERFGADFDAYCARVPRWLGRRR
jgi:protein-S-isoprenylcysteine O-methyltransferase Ste14